MQFFCTSSNSFDVLGPYNTRQQLFHLFFFCLNLTWMFPKTSLFHLFKSFPQFSNPLANSSILEIRSCCHPSLITSAHPSCRIHIFSNLKDFLLPLIFHCLLERWKRRGAWSEMGATKCVSHTVGNMANQESVATPRSNFQGSCSTLYPETKWKLVLWQILHEDYNHTVLA